MFFSHLPTLIFLYSLKIFTVFTLDELKTKYVNGELRFVKKTQSSRRKLIAKCWQIFQLIEYLDGEDYVKVSNFVYCTNCKTFHAYNGTTTTALNNHKCEKNQPTLGEGSFVIPTKKSNIKFTAEDKKLMKDGSKDFIVVDLRPFYAIQGQGLKSLVSSVVSIAHKYPTATADEIVDLMPSRNTLKKHVIDDAKLTVSDIKIILQKVLEFPGEMTIAVDLWKDSYRGHTYAGIVAHFYVEEKKNFVRKNIVLSIANLDCLTKTNKNIRDHILKIFWNNYGIDEAAYNTKVKGICDRGLNVLLALSGPGRIVLHCYCHLLNNLVENMCKCDGVKEIIKNASALAGFLKLSGLNSDLPKTVKSNVPTRWNTVYMMLLSISSQYETIKKLLEDKENDIKKYTYKSKLTCLDQDDLIVLCKFLKLFCDLSEKLEGEKFTTLHRVWPTYKRVLAWLEVVDVGDDEHDDRPLIVEMKRAGQEYIRKNIKDFAPELEHRLSLFLHPLHKNLLGFVESDERDVIHRYAEKRMESYFVPPENENVAIRTNDADDDLFGEWMDTVDTGNDSLSNEIMNYTMFSVSTVSEIFLLALIFTFSLKNLNNDFGKNCRSLQSIYCRKM